MENKQYYWVNAIGLVVSILFFCTSAYLLVRNGYARDEGIYVLDFFGNGLWLLLIGSIICCIIFLTVSNIKNEKISLTVASFTIVILIVFGLIITFGWFISYNKAQNDDFQSDNISLITFEELKGVIDADGTHIIYIGRKSCPLCAYIMTDFQSFIEDSNLEVMYYSTTQDRDTRPEEMREVLNSINVHSIPTTIILHNGEIVKMFVGKDMVDDMRKHFKYSS